MTSLVTKLGAAIGVLCLVSACSPSSNPVPAPSISSGAARVPNAATPAALNALFQTQHNSGNQRRRANTTPPIYTATGSFPASSATTNATGVVAWGAFTVNDGSIIIAGIDKNASVLWGLHTGISTGGGSWISTMTLTYFGSNKNGGLVAISESSRIGADKLYSSYLAADSAASAGLPPGHGGGGPIANLRAIKHPNAASQSSQACVADLGNVVNRAANIIWETGVVAGDWTALAVAIAAANGANGTCPVTLPLDHNTNPGGYDGWCNIQAYIMSAQFYCNKLDY